VGPDALGEAVLARARAGDEEAFREITEPHRRELQLHCYRILGSVQDAGDTVQVSAERAAAAGPDASVEMMQEPARCLVGGPEGGACRPTAPGEELGFGLPQRCRGRLAVQVLRGDRAPVCASAQLP
jgi:hypothetical protein